MAIVVVETTYDAPVTQADWDEDLEKSTPCFQEHDIRWVRSLISADRRRTISELEAPDAEMVRQSYRKVDIAFDRVWTAEVRQPDEQPLVRNNTKLTVVEGTYPSLTEEQWDEANRLLFPCYEERGVQWISSFISLDRCRTICELAAPNAEAIRDSYRKTGLPFDRVWTAEVIEP